MAKRKITLTRTVDEKQAKQLAAEARKRGYKARISKGRTNKPKTGRKDSFTPDFNFDR